MRSSYFLADLLQRSALSRLIAVGVTLVALWVAIFWAITLP